MSKDWNGNKKKELLSMLNNRDKGICQWKELSGYESRFLISTKGDVFSLYSLKPMKLTILPNGYHYLPIMLQKPKRHVKTAYIHRLVAETFIPNPLKKETVNHKDGNKWNNTVENLEWATQSEQNYHATRVLGIKRNTGKISEYNHSRRAFTDDEVRFIRKSNLKPKQIMSILGKICDYSVIYDIRSGKNYKDVI